MMPRRSAFLALGLVLAIAGYGCVHRQGSQAPRAELKAAHAEIEELTESAQAVSASTDISRDTAARVDIAGAETRQRATQARERILERVETEPVPAGNADPVVLHEASEAYDAAIRSTCRVQRTDDCPPPAAAAD